MKIAVVATHSFPIPWKTHTGDVVILDLAAGLSKLGHEVMVLAPEGTSRSRRTTWRRCRA